MLFFEQLEENKVLPIINIKSIYPFLDHHYRYYHYLKMVIMIIWAKWRRGKCCRKATNQEGVENMANYQKTPTTFSFFLDVFMQVKAERGSENWKMAEENDCLNVGALRVGCFGWLFGVKNIMVWLILY